MIEQFNYGRNQRITKDSCRILHFLEKISVTLTYNSIVLRRKNKLSEMKLLRMIISSRRNIIFRLPESKWYYAMIPSIMILLDWWFPSVMEFHYCFHALKVITETEGEKLARNVGYLADVFIIPSLSKVGNLITSLIFQKCASHQFDAEIDGWIGARLFQLSDYFFLLLFSPNWNTFSLIYFSLNIFLVIWITQESWDRISCW